MRNIFSLQTAAAASGYASPLAESETLRMIRAEFRTAHDVQSCLFPHQMRRVEGLDYYGECQPAGDIGGDFFDFVPFHSKGLFVSVGDVSGHGIGAAIIMSGLQSLLRSLSAGESNELPRIVQGLNRSVCEISPDNFYATLFYGLVDPVRRQLKYVSAGHEPALLFHQRTGRMRRLESTGTVLGLTARSNYTQHIVPVEPGDVLVAFTDGITEAADGNGEEFREEGVLRILRHYPKAGAVELSGRIMDAVDDFRTRTAHADDRTVAVVRMIAAAEKEPFRRQAEEFELAAA
jgi:phosphoserine phosphatase RsbU/P